jgi:hypothetical protein
MKENIFLFFRNNCEFLFWQTAMSPGVPVIVFRGVSDLAGGEPTWSSTSLMDLASINALKAAIEFIDVLGKQNSSAYI